MCSWIGWLILILLKVTPNEAFIEGITSLTTACMHAAEFEAMSTLYISHKKFQISIKWLKSTII